MSIFSFRQRIIYRTCLSAGLGILVLAAVPLFAEPLHFLAAGNLFFIYTYSMFCTPFLYVILSFWAGRSLDLLEDKLLKNSEQDSA